MTAEKILTKYAELLRNAVFIFDARFGSIMESGDSYMLAIEGGEAVLTWRRARTNPHPDSQFTTQSRRIPITVLNQELQTALSWAAVQREQEVLLYQRLKGEIEGAAPAPAALWPAPIEPKPKARRIKNKGRRK